jgi:hypothetical protein
MYWKFTPAPTLNSGVTFHEIAGLTLIVRISESSAW